MKEFIERGEAGQEAEWGLARIRVRGVLKLQIRQTYIKNVR